jgi:hypothetical protein
MVRQQPGQPQRPLWLLQGLRRLVVVVIERKANQLYSAVATVVGLGTTRERAKRYRGIF